MALIFDGDWLITALSKRKATKPISKKMERLRSLQSIRADLERCQAALEAMSRDQEERKELTRALSSEEGLRDASLSTLLILLYSRSTDVSSARGGFDPRRFYSIAQRGWHDSIIKLRNEAVAHFGSGRHEGWPWAKDNLQFILDTKTGTMSFGYKYERSNIRGRVIAELGVLLPIAIEGLRSDTIKVENSILNEINALGENYTSVLQHCPVIEDRPDGTPSWTTQTHHRRAHLLED